MKPYIRAPIHSPVTSDNMAAPASEPLNKHRKPMMPTCNDMTNKLDLIDDNCLHELYRYNIVFMCPECKDVCPFLNDFTKHIKSSHNSERMSAIIRIQCTLCGEVTGSKEVFTQHVRVIHSTLDSTAAPFQPAQHQPPPMVHTAPQPPMVHTAPPPLRHYNLPRYSHLAMYNVHSSFRPEPPVIYTSSLRGMPMYNQCLPRCYLCHVDSSAWPHPNLIMVNGSHLCKKCYCVNAATLCTAPTSMPSSSPGMLSGYDLYKQDCTVVNTGAGSKSSNPFSSASFTTSDGVEGEEGEAEDNDNTSLHSLDIHQSTDDDYVAADEDIPNGSSFVDGVYSSKYTISAKGNNLNSYKTKVLTKDCDAIADILPITKCPFCAEDFDSPDSTKCHMKEQHPGDEEDKESDTSISSSTDNNSQSVDSLSIGKLPGLEPEIVSSNYNFVCKVCEEQCKSYAGLDEHLRFKHTLSRVTCNICGDLEFFTTDACARHLLEAHSFLDIACQHCKVAFGNADCLKDHMKNKHLKLLIKYDEVSENSLIWGDRLNISNFACWLCGKLLKTSDGLQDHIRNKHFDKP